jgi:hypothetical protein
MYAPFIIMYSTATAILVFWEGYLVFAKPRDDLIVKCFLTGIFLYACVAVVIWIIDMNMCDQLLPYYTQFYGCTAHVIWHVTAGLGAHLGVLNFVLLRSRALKIPVKMAWAYGIPIVVEIDSSKKK